MLFKPFVISHTKVTYCEEVRKCNVWEIFMGFVFSTLAFAFSPKLQQNVIQGTRWTQIEGIFLRDGIF